ncbi:uncharacterized protein LOC141695775 [Apium graveolens]|uniref:uncharacterized protein LOC141695775 n=1 Tax=Apium graveolens TaxID=4045 RepID=UPI003D7B0A83
MGFLRPKSPLLWLYKGGWGECSYSHSSLLISHISSNFLLSLNLPPLVFSLLPFKVSRLFPALLMADKSSERAAKIASASKRAAKEINEDNVPLVEETARMKKARLAGLDTRGKATEPIFLKKHKEPIGEVSTEGAGGHGAPITAAAPTAAATGAFQPLWGFRRGDTVVGSTKHAWDWSYHSVTPKDFTDVVATPDLERIKLMGAQSLASVVPHMKDLVELPLVLTRSRDLHQNYEDVAFAEGESKTSNYALRAKSRALVPQC